MALGSYQQLVNGTMNHHTNIYHLRQQVELKLDPTELKCLNSAWIPINLIRFVNESLLGLSTVDSVRSKFVPKKEMGNISIVGLNFASFIRGYEKNPGVTMAWNHLLLGVLRLNEGHLAFFVIPKLQNLRCDSEDYTENIWLYSNRPVEELAFWVQVLSNVVRKKSMKVDRKHLLVVNMLCECFNCFLSGCKCIPISINRF